MAAIAMAHKRARERKWNEVAQDVGEQLNPEPQARFFERAGPGQRLTNVIGPWVGSGLAERSSARAWQRGGHQDRHGSFFRDPDSRGTLQRGALIKMNSEWANAE